MVYVHIVHSPSHNCFGSVGSIFAAFRLGVGTCSIFTSARRVDGPPSAVYASYQDVKNAHIGDVYSSSRARHKVAASKRVNAFHGSSTSCVSNAVTSLDVHPMHMNWIGSFRPERAVIRGK